MKLIKSIFLLFSTILIFGQNRDENLTKKFESYKYLDTINTYSKNYPTRLIEGSGTIKNKKKKIIGSIGFETEITKNIGGKVIRIHDSQSHFYKKTRKNPAKTISYSTSIYFNEFEKPDFAKVQREEIIGKKIISSKTEFYEIQKIDFTSEKLGFNETRIRRLIFELNN